MRLTRYLKAEQVKMELETALPDPVPETWSPERCLWYVKEGILRELVALLDAAGKVSNPSKMLQDLLNRERKASTSLGHGLAVPHVRTMQAREFALAFGRSTRGLEFDAPDGQPVHFFICCVAPPYDDRLYLQLYKRIGEVFLKEANRRRLAAARDAHEIVRVLSEFDEV
jgi:PTS system fructose-specific IIC component